MKTVRRGQNYHVDCVLGDRRLRFSLGTKDAKVAGRLRNRLEFAIADGPNSKVWPEIQPILPERTYRKMSSHVGVPRELAMTWDELLSIFWTERERNWAKSTEKGYSRVCRVFGEFLNGVEIFRVKNITPETITSFQSGLEAASEDRAQFRNGAGLQNDLGMLSQVFKFAVDRKMMTANPIRQTRQKSERQITQPFSAEELGRLRVCAIGQERLMFILLRWTGLRGSDAVALPWSSINWTDGEIRSVSKKTGVEVVIPMHPELDEALTSWRSVNLDTVLCDVATDRPTLYRRCLALGKKAGVDNCRPHRFRDTLAVDMLLRGATVFEVSKVLGNTVSVVESHYSPFVPALRSKLKQILNDDKKGLEAR